MKAEEVQILNSVIIPLKMFFVINLRMLHNLCTHTSNVHVLNKWWQFSNNLWCLILLEICFGILSDSRWTDTNPRKGWGNKGYSTGTEWKTWASRGRAILMLFSLLGVYTSRNILALCCIQNKIHVTCQLCHEQENKGGSREKNKLVKWKGKLIFWTDCADQLKSTTLKVVPSIWVRWNQNGPFHLNSN